ncbi:hypothetical protein PCASD_24241 [Puccinia coronata f. sp. avenae]|uniref:Uncharacterized protein n=1 Tax=Puccinia coronata f. sp. avenae TaxID=200324 RepID=A0A2N5THN7_9BASI|nr:hypothetical protein PCASD_24241 [Puccinia coronata f. sp. avenae]
MTSRAPSPSDSEMGGGSPPSPPPIHAPLPYRPGALDLSQHPPPSSPHHAQPALPPPGLIDNESTSTILSKWVDDEFFVRLTHFLRKDQPSNKDVLLLLLSSMTQLEQRMAQQQERSMRVLEGKIASLTAPPHCTYSTTTCTAQTEGNCCPSRICTCPPKANAPPQPIHPRTSADEFVEVQTKKNRKKSYANAATAAAATTPTNRPRTPPNQLAHRRHMHAKSHALPISVRLSKKGAIVITTAPRCEAASIKANIEALLPTISTATNTLREKAVCQADDKVQFLVNMVPTATDATDDDNLQFMKRQLAANCNGKVPTSVRFLKSKQDRAASKSQGEFTSIIAEWDDEPLPVFAGMGLQQATTFQMLNRRAKHSASTPPTNHHHSTTASSAEHRDVTYQPVSSPANTPPSSVACATRRPTTTPSIPSALPT